jgi:hypothetical protein
MTTKRRGRERGKPDEIEFPDEPRQPWDRQPKEGDKAWRCFVMYRDALQEGGIGTRSQRAVSAAMYPHRDPTKARVKEIAYWSTQWRWVERVEAYERHLDQERLRLYEAEARRDAVQALRLLRGMRAKAAQGLVQLNPEAMTPSEVTRMADTAITAIRREAGLSTEITATERDDAFAAWLTGDVDAPDESRVES